jgi:acyl-CoA reductase-like NAD-dependent aldehyde dehydrogenase
MATRGARSIELIHHVIGGAEVESSDGGKILRDLRAPFGGVGDSGWGREGGDYSREFCTEPKAIVMDI